VHLDQFRYRQQMAFARAEREVFDVEAEIDRQPLAVRPRIVRAVNNWGVGITIVIGKLHIDIPAKGGLKLHEIRRSERKLSRFRASPERPVSALRLKPQLADRP
jgi:hypothetical protein